MKVALKILKIKGIIENLKNNTEVNYPLTESKKIILISLQKSRIGISECINLALLIEAQNKKIKPSKDPKINLSNFFSTCTKDFDLTNKEIEKIKEILNLSRAQRQSSMDFKRDGKIVLLAKDLNYEITTIDKIKEYTQLIEIIFQKIIINSKVSSLK